MMDMFAKVRNRLSRSGLLAPMVLLLAVGATAVSPQAAAAPAAPASARSPQGVDNHHEA